MNEILNPYIAGAPVVESSMFFGREDVFRWIERSLTGKYVGHILVLHGQRRVGKTSVLKQIPNFLPKHYIQIFFDLQGRTGTTLDRFLWWLASEIVRTLRKEVENSLPKPDAKSFEDPDYLINEFIPGLKPLLGERILLLTFDEFDTLDRAEIRETLANPLIAYLRRLVEIEGLNFIFSIGSSGHKLENMQASYTDFFKSALYRKISFLTADDCRSLITKPVEGVIEYDHQAITRITDITSGHPYFTQLMCHELFSRCQKTGSREIAVEDVEAILDDVIERGTVNLKFVWDEANDLEKWVLAGLASLDSGVNTQQLSKLLQAQRVRFSDPDLNSAIIHLRDKDVLTAENRFIIHLLRMWLQANRPLERVREELVEVNPIANRYIEIGDEYHDRGQFQQAIKSYQQAMHANPGNLKAQTSIAALHLQQKAYPEAVEAFGLALQIDDEDVTAKSGYCDASQALGQKALAAGDTETAIQYFKKVLVVNNSHADARHELASIFRRQAESQLTAGHEAEALKSFQQAMEYTPDDDQLSARYQQVLVEKKTRAISDYSDKANKALNRQRWDEAASLIEEALKLDPKDTALQARLVEVKDAPRQAKLQSYKREAEQAISKGNWDKALEAIETAILLDPHDAKLRQRLDSVRSDQQNAQYALYRGEADTAISSGNWDGAILALEHLLKLQPDGADIQSEIDQLKVEKRNSELAAYLQQAEAASQAEDWEIAVQVWEKYLALSPDDGRQAESKLDHARKFAGLSQDYNQAQQAMHKKRYRKAIELLQGIIAQDPTYKATSRLLVEAVEANKTIPIWRRPWVYVAVAIVAVITLAAMNAERLSNVISSILAPLNGAEVSESTSEALSTTSPVIDEQYQVAYNATRSLTLSYQTGFDTWEFDSPEGEYGEIVDGKLVVASTGEHVGVSLPIDHSSSFAVELDLEIEDLSPEGHCIYYFEDDGEGDEHQSIANAFFANGEWILAYITSHENQEELAKGDFNEQITHTFTFIVLGDQITAFIDGQFAFTAVNPKGIGYYSMHTFAASKGIGCTYDNFKLWDLSATEAEGLFGNTAPNIYMDNTPPTFRDVFWTPDSNWGSLSISDGSYNLQDMMYGGRLHINLPAYSGKLTFPENGLFDGHDFILALDFIPVELRQYFDQNYHGIRFRESEDGESYYEFALPTGRNNWWVTRKDSTGFQQVCDGSFKAADPVKVVLYAQGSDFTLFLNDTGVCWGGDDQVTGEKNSIVISYVDDSYDVDIDNVYFWNLDNVQLPGLSGESINKIAFTSDRNGTADIYVMDIDGQNVTQLTFNNVDDYDPAWSPDGTRIAFVSDRGGSANIYVMDADGGNLMELTRDLGDETSPTWSPDGGKIAYVASENGRSDIFIISSDGSNIVQATNNANNIDPEWSPDGKKILFASDRSGSYDIYALDADLQNTVQLTNDPYDDIQPDWSPDGKQIVFVSARNINWHLFLMDADGNNVAQLTNGDDGENTPAWSPEGGKIVFSSSSTNNGDLYMMNADGSNAVQLTQYPGEETHPAWGLVPLDVNNLDEDYQEVEPQAGGIVFISDRTGNSEIYRMDLNGSNLEQLTNTPRKEENPSWSPDGTKILFSAGAYGTTPTSQIYVMDADGANEVLLTSLILGSSNPAWSPDGSKIVFESQRNDDQGTRIFVMDADGGNQTELVGFEGHLKNPAWSPDGSKIIFSSFLNTTDNWSIYDLYVLDADGGNIFQLTNTPDESEDEPAISPDGSMIVFSSSRDGVSNIFVMDADGSNRVQLTDNSANNTNPVWSADGSEIIFTSDGNGNWDIYVMDVDGDNVVQLTNDSGWDLDPDWRPDN